MNSYFRAILQATSYGKFPGLCDIWRNYHPTAIMSDSDYQYMTDTGDIILADQDDLHFVNSSEGISKKSCRFDPTTLEEERTGEISEKGLYVPVTRKVSPLERKNVPNSPCKVSITDDTKSSKIYSGMN